MSVCSGNAVQADSLVDSTESNRHSSTFVACAEKIAKLTPTPVHVAPRGYGSPGHTRMGSASSRSMPRRSVLGPEIPSPKSPAPSPVYSGVEYRSLNQGSAEFE